MLKHEINTKLKLNCWECNLSAVTMDRREADTSTLAEHVAFTAIWSYRNAGTYAQGHLRVSIQDKIVCVCVCARARERALASYSRTHFEAPIGQGRKNWTGFQREREGESNLEKCPHFEAQLGYIRFLDLVHIDLLLALNSELYSNMEEKEVVRRG